MGPRETELKDTSRHGENVKGIAALDTLKEQFGLEGKTALVTGAARGLGEQIAKSLAGAGATVIASDRDLAGCEDTVSQINSAGGTAYAIQMDIGDQAAVLAAFQEVERLLSGSLDILVNNAGMIAVAPLFDDRMDIWDRAYEVNVRGTFLCCREGARIMRKAGKGGRIVNISSASAVRPVLEGIAPYSSSKAAVSAFSQSLCYELAPDNITVNVVLPHAIIHPTVSDQYEENKSPVTAGAAMDPKRYRLPRGGVPQDIAGLVTFLAGPAGGYISGQSIAVDGGYMLT